MARGSRMRQRYSGRQGSFAAAVAQFRDQALAAGDAIYQRIMLDLSAKVIEKSPVGDPERWAANVAYRQRASAAADRYDENVAIRNTLINLNPSNFTKNGKLRRGVKHAKPLTKAERDQNFDVNGMVVGRGYVGGRFRANWQFSIGTAAQGEIDDVDPTGSKAISAVTAGVQPLKLGDTAYLVNNLPYAVPLEYGHSSQAPAGMVRVTSAEFQQIVEAAVRANQV
ncbi:hypothetical protein [Pseudomonas aeruginosa]|uniref:hypothetical protein n=1 Tax=Pseudomonas aeruginosa TaxID=287 RepID=UPI003D7AD7E2|nr:hypothetical protein [Pseudomonas aeruginosa]